MHVYLLIFKGIFRSIRITFIKKGDQLYFFNILPIRFNVFDFATFFVLLTLSNRGGSTSEKFELAVQIFMWSS